jgi:hypothetical protein
MRDEYCRLTAEGFDFKVDGLVQPFHFNSVNPFSRWDDTFTIPLIFLSNNAKLSIEASYPPIENKPVYFEEYAAWELDLVIRSSVENIDHWESMCFINLESKLKKAGMWTTVKLFVWEVPDYIDFIISDSVGVYRVRYFYDKSMHRFYAVTKEQ